MKKLVLHTLRNTTVIAVLGIGIHSIFHDWFYSMDVAGRLFRPEGPMRSFVVPGSLLMGFAIAILFRGWPRTRSWVADGLGYGAAIFSFAFGLGVLVTYGSSNVDSVTWIVGEGLFVASYCVINGLAMARLNPPPGTPAAT